MPGYDLNEAALGSVEIRYRIYFKIAFGIKRWKWLRVIIFQVVWNFSDGLMLVSSDSIGTSARAATCSSSTSTTSSATSLSSSKVKRYFF